MISFVPPWLNRYQTSYQRQCPRLPIQRDYWPCSKKDFQIALHFGSAAAKWFHSFRRTSPALEFGVDPYRLRQMTVVFAKNSTPCSSIVAACTTSISDRSSDAKHHEKSVAGDLTSVHPHRWYHTSDPCKGARRAHLCVDSAGGDGGSGCVCVLRTHTPSLAWRITGVVDKGEDRPDLELWAHSN